MKTNTSDLTGTALDWAVALAEGHKPPLLRVLRGHVALPDVEDPMNCDYLEYSTVWELGGPIIDRERISVLPFDGRWEARCAASITRTPARFIERRGPTPLVAAMRCYVASKLGDTVDVPDELMGCL